MAQRKKYFGNVQEVLKAKKLDASLESMLEELHEGWLQGQEGVEFQKKVLQKHGWHTESSIGIPDRRYAYDGFRDGVAIEIEWNQVEKVLSYLLKFQYGFSKQDVELGIIITIGDRSKQSPVDESESGGEREIAEMTKEIITIPILLVVFYHEGTV